MAGAVTAAAIAAVTVAEIAAGVAVGDAVADARAADVRRVPQAGAICLPRNMHHHKVASPADMIIAAESRAVTTIGVPKLRAARRLHLQVSPRKKSFFRVNRWQNIAASLQLRPRLPPLLSTKHTKSRVQSKKLHRARPAICPQPLRAAAAFLADSPAGCPAGSWPMPALNPKRLPQQPVKLPKRRKLRPSKNPRLFVAMPI